MQRESSKYSLQIHLRSKDLTYRTSNAKFRYDKRPKWNWIPSNCDRKSTREYLQERIYRNARWCLWSFWPGPICPTGCPGNEQNFGTWPSAFFRPHWDTSAKMERLFDGFVKNIFLFSQFFWCLRFFWWKLHENTTKSFEKIVWMEKMQPSFSALLRHTRDSRRRSQKLFTTFDRERRTLGIFFEQFLRKKVKLCVVT